MTIYINGYKASKKDLLSLEKDIKQGTQQATAHKTKKGNLAIKTQY